MLTSSTDSLRKTTGDPAPVRPADSAAQKPVPPSSSVLAVEIAHQPGEPLVLTPGRWRIGSGHPNEITISSSAVAPRHAVIVVTEQRVLMTAWADATLVNGRRCHEALLGAGDILTVGNVDLILRAADAGELIDQLPHVGHGSGADHPAADIRVSAGDIRQDPFRPHRTVSADEALHRLDHLDTAIGILNNEFHGHPAADDQLNSVIDRIENDLSRRDPEVMTPAVTVAVPSDITPADSVIPDVSPSAAAPSNAAVLTEVSPGADTRADTRTVPGQGTATDAGSRPQHRPFDLDQLMNSVDPRADEDEIAEADDAFEASADDATAAPEEFAQLVGSTSVLAQNLTLNALRSRAEAVRQLDELVLAASSAHESAPDSPGASRPVHGTRNEPDASFASPGSPAEATGFSEFDDSAEDHPDDRETTDVCRDRHDRVETEVDSHPDSASADRDSLAATGHSAEPPAVPEDTSAADTVEFSPQDTVQETGSLLASLLRDPSETEPADRHVTDCNGQSPVMNDTAPEADSMTEDAGPTHVAASVPESTDPVSNETAAGQDASADSVSDPSRIRSQLAEMFDIPSLTTDAPSPAETEGRREEIPADAPTPLQASASDRPAAAELPHPAEAQLTAWLDDQSRPGCVEPPRASQEQPELPAGLGEAVPADAPTDTAPTDTAPTDTTDDDDPVAAYMKDLLARNRARTGQPEYTGYQNTTPDTSIPLEGSGEPVRSSVIEEAADSHADQEDHSEPAAPVQPSTERTGSWLAQEPRHQLDKDRVRAETQTLREVANQTARSAVTTATRRQLKTQVIVKSSASIVMLGSGIAASVLGVSLMFTCLVLALGVCFTADLGLTVARNWKLIRP